MKRVIMKKEDEQTIDFKDVDKNGPIFCKRNNKYAGKVIHEKEGWMLRFDNGRGEFGPYPTLKKLVETAMGFGNKFYVN